jgi:ubiquinone/menaquinone biosynthesis C-methylase UbiE
MPSIRWTGKLSPSTAFLINVSALLAWAQGQARDTEQMKKRVRDGYDGAFTDHIHGYDDYGLETMAKIATAELEGVNIAGKEVLDVGCGTGVLSLLALERGAARVVGGDASTYMLTRAREKAAALDMPPTKIEFKEMDAERLPVADASFDLVLSSLALGMVPNQKKAVAEMARVTRHGGQVVVGTHGREYLWEVNELLVRQADKRRMTGYRSELWHLTERDLASLFRRAGLADVQTREIHWMNRFPSGGEAWDFMAAISGCWWYERFPPEERMADAARMRAAFERAGVKELTEHVVVASGWKR